MELRPYEAYTEQDLEIFRREAAYNTTNIKQIDQQKHSFSNNKQAFQNQKGAKNIGMKLLRHLDANQYIQNDPNNNCNRTQTVHNNRDSSRNNKARNQSPSKKYLKVYSKLNSNKKEQVEQSKNKSGQLKTKRMLQNDSNMKYEIIPENNKQIFEETAKIRIKAIFNDQNNTFTNRYIQTVSTSNTKNTIKQFIEENQMAQKEMAQNTKKRFKQNNQNLLSQNFNHKQNRNVSQFLLEAEETPINKQLKNTQAQIIKNNPHIQTFQKEAYSYSKRFQKNLTNLEEGVKQLSFRIRGLQVSELEIQSQKIHKVASSSIINTKQTQTHENTQFLTNLQQQSQPQIPKSIKQKYQPQFQSIKQGYLNDSANSFQIVQEFSQRQFSYIGRQEEAIEQLQKNEFLMQNYNKKIIKQQSSQKQPVLSFSNFLSNQNNYQEQFETEMIGSLEVREPKIKAKESKDANINIYKNVLQKEKKNQTIHQESIKQKQKYSTMPQKNSPQKKQNGKLNYQLYKISKSKHFSMQKQAIPNKNLQNRKFIKYKVTYQRKLIDI